MFSLLKYTPTYDYQFVAGMPMQTKTAYIAIIVIQIISHLFCFSTMVIRCYKYNVSFQANPVEDHASNCDW